MTKANVLLQKKGQRWSGRDPIKLYCGERDVITCLESMHSDRKARAADVHYKRSDMNRLMFDKDHFSGVKGWQVISIG